MTAVPASPRRYPRMVPPQGPLGVFAALAVLVVVVGGAALIGWLVSGAVSAVLPAAPAYLILLVMVPVMIVLMVVALRLFPWMQSWYYLVPALVFLIAFTILPILLTINYAFTNYSGINSGYGDTSVKTPVTLSSDRRQLTFSALPEGSASLSEFLACAKPSCAGDSTVLYDPEGATPVFARIQSVNGLNVTLSAPVAESFKVSDATRLNAIRRVGLANFRSIFSRASEELIPVFVWTVVFAFGTVVTNALAGLILGILLYNKRLKGRNIYRTLLFLPWAIPSVITIQMWGALLNQQFGVVNKTLGLLGVSAVPWLTDPLWAKISILVVNLWLGFPYMMTATISALSTISDDLYEAASIDGASRWQQIVNITLPLLRNSFTPILLSGFAFNFNNFGVIYLLTQGGPAVAGRTSTAGSTDILLSWGYNTAFASSGGQNYALASAIAMIVFFLTLAISLVNFRAAGVFEEARR
ncbi:ABC transporter permease subunit [Deinococcus sonorensis]|uniref:Maltose/maltodextrin transport system permease protein n=2 Tax=Deinococcus sonorensis TaxID=309891 RepID=A0AAU7U7Y6_9DEIO